jgi:hypothetical protein
MKATPIMTIYVHRETFRGTNLFDKWQAKTPPDAGKNTLILAVKCQAVKGYEDARGRSRTVYVHQCMPMPQM